METVKEVNFHQTEDRRKKFLSKATTKMFGWLTSFGTFVSGLLGIFVIWKAITTKLNTGHNIFLLYQTFGWSIKILAGIFSSGMFYAY